MLDPESAACLEPTAEVVCLIADPETIIERIGDTAQRPLLAGPDASERVRRLLDERAEGYGRFDSVDTEGRSAEEVADAVMSLLGL